MHVVHARATLPLALALVLGAAGCDFFKELQSAEGATDGSGTGGGTDTEAVADTDLSDVCEFPADDRCINQDTLARCDLATNTPTVYDCASLCGDFENFACVNTGQGHGCWCVEPGVQKVLSCSELEECLKGCTWDATADCSDKCFSRTTMSTIRMYGALVHCVHDDCRDLCIQQPEACAGCVDNGIANGSGPCGLERSVCDADRNDEEPY